MKKILVTTFVLIFALSALTNCKKKYKCECTNINHDTGQTYMVENSYEKKLTKSQANQKKDLCEAMPDCAFVRDK